MIKLKKLKLNKYCQHRNLTIVFSDSATVITGANGKGKSNLINACKFCLTGITSNSGPRTSDLMWGEKKGDVTLWFTIDKKPYKLIRYLHNSGALLYKIVNRKAEEIAGTATEVETALEKLLGLPISSVGQVFIAQGEITSAIFSTKTQRAAMFNKLFNTDQTLARDHLQNEILEASTVSGNSAVVAELQSQLDGDITPQLVHLRDKLLNSRVGLPDASDSKELVRKYEAYQKAVNTHREKIAQLSKLKEELKTLKVEQKEVVNLLPADPGSDLEKLNEAIEKRTLLSSTITTYLEEKANYNLAQLHIAKNVKLLVDTTPSNNDDHKLFGNRVTELQEKVNNGIRERDRVEERIDLVEKGDCPTCGTTFDDHEHQLDELTGELEVVTKDLDLNVVALNTANKEYKRCLTLHSEFEKVEAVVKSKNAELLLLEEPLSVVNYTEKGLDKCKELLKKDTEKRNHIENIMGDCEEINNKVKIKQDLILAITIDEVTGCDITHTDYIKANKLILDAEEKEKEATRYETLFKALLDREGEVTMRLRRAKELEAKSKSLNTYRALCEKTRDILHNSNLPATVNRKYIEVLNELLAKYMAMFGTVFTCYITEDFDFMVSFVTESEPKSALRLSGGQKSTLAISFWFAVSELFTGGLGLIVFDEPSSWLDKNAIESMREVFAAVGRSMVNSGTQLVVITHEESLKDSFDSCIEIV